jgi:hypothetical protein
MMTADKVQEDGHLPAALQHLSDAISRLIDPKPATHDGQILWTESLWDQLCDAIPGSQGNRSAVPQSSPPLNLDASELKREIDQAVAVWEPKSEIDASVDDPPHLTIIRIRALQQRRWRPQDVTAIDAITTSITAWSVAIHTLLNPTPRWTLPNPCPACNTATVHRRNTAGDMVRQPALQIGPTGCVCQNCRHEWAPQMFMFLARTLGYHDVPGVLE